MERSGSEMTRAFLLNSHSRGSLEEVAGEDDILGFSAEGGQDEEDEPAFYYNWEGRDLTRKMYLQSYD